MTNPRRIWLDSAATTPLAAEVAEAVAPWLRPGIAANPSSLHAEGRAARRTLEQIRERIGSAFGVPPNQITFTGSATEANNLALSGSLRALPAGARPHSVVTSALEHESVLNTLHLLEREGVAEVTLIPGTPDGRPDSDRAREALAQGPALISLMHVNNETGIIQPIDEWADSARAANPDVIVHCDAVQAIPRLAEIAPKADLVVLSGHKIHGPPGVGLLVARRTLQLAPLILGGPQEGGRRAGTEPLALIAGLDAAVNLALEQQPFAHTQLHMLEEIFRQTLMEAGVRHEINAESSPRVPGLLSLWLPDIESDDLVIAADLEGLALSAASACQSGTPERSHVLHAMGLSSERIRHTVRVGFHRNQLPGDACEAAERIAAVVARTRR